ncbi:hypothetical protein HMF3257_35030 [Spirosoma telluris]|uniref:Uncharacterized protein n=1 Tax=Spirosoma telluris TaxID=2183553 RepID=A0A327NRW6_9BACT|nr:hypothetical protein HMF3257_35030 [Spirosoma telluris]
MVFFVYRKSRLIFVIPDAKSAPCVLEAPKLLINLLSCTLTGLVLPQEALMLVRVLLKLTPKGLPAHAYWL